MNEPKSKGIALLLGLMFVSQTAMSSQWIFPGEPLPGDLQLVPLKVSAQSGSDLQVKAMDWFQLRPATATNTKGAFLFGPIADDLNGHLQARLTVGMILSQTMQQMGLSRAEAIAAVQGQNNSPTLQRFAKDWQRPLYRLSQAPYLLLPLIVAMEESNLQHFRRANANPGEATDLMCSNIQTKPPLAPIQTLLAAEKAAIEKAEQELRTAQGLFDQTNFEIVRLTRELQQSSRDVEVWMQCISSLRERVNAGGVEITENCLQEAAAVMKSVGNEKEWQRFTSQNLARPTPDFVVEKEAAAQLGLREVEQTTLRAQVAALIEQQSAAQKIIEDSESKQAELQKSLALAGQEETEIKATIAASQKELKELQEVTFSLENGTAAANYTNDQVKELIAGTPQRRNQIEKLKKDIPKLFDNLAKIQATQAAIFTQIDFLNREIERSKVTITSVQNQLGSEEAQSQGLVNQLKVAEKALATAAAEHQKAQDEYRFASFVLASLAKKLIIVTENRDKITNLIQGENTKLATSQKQIEAAAASKQKLLALTEPKIAQLTATLAPYLNREKMGWFLESECAQEANSQGIFIARIRGPSEPASAPATGTAVVGGGAWGLYGISHARYTNSIESGVLLNMHSLNEMVIRDLVQAVDEAILSLSQGALSCGENRVALNLTNVLAVSLHRWKDGAITAAKFCADQKFGSAVASALGQIDPRQESGLLARWLPKSGQAQAEQLIERNLLESLFDQLALFSAQAVVSDDKFIQAMIAVLATDYTQLVRSAVEASATTASKYQFAGEVPAAAGLRGQLNEIKVGQVRELRSLGAPKVFSRPIPNAQNQVSANFTWGDQFIVRGQVLTDGTEVATRGGWVKVSPVGSEQTELWMNALYLTTGPIVSAEGIEVFDLRDEALCPVRRVVTEMTNFARFDTQVSRFLPELRVSNIGGGNWQMNWQGNRRTTPASLTKRYIACELFELPGRKANNQAAAEFRNKEGIDYSNLIAVRIVEAIEITTRSGKKRWLPIENGGGFVHVWLNNKNRTTPRIVLGPKLDATTWEQQ